MAGLTEGHRSKLPGRYAVFPLIARLCYFISHVRIPAEIGLVADRTVTLAGLAFVHMIDPLWKQSGRRSPSRRLGEYRDCPDRRYSPALPEHRARLTKAGLLFLGFRSPNRRDLPDARFRLVRDSGQRGDPRALRGHPLFKPTLRQSLTRSGHFAAKSRETFASHTRPHGTGLWLRGLKCLDRCLLPRDCSIALMVGVHPRALPR